MVRAASVTILIWLGAPIFLLTPMAQAASDGPSLTVFLERSDIRESDSVRVFFQVTNSGSAQIASSIITIISPGSLLVWHCGGCAQDSAPISEIDTGKISPGQSVDAEAWFVSGSNISIGQFNLLFRLNTLSDAKPSQRSVSLVEKTISVKLLGTDTLAGIPLALSGLIIPGLCFWLVVSWFGAKWGVGLALGDKLIYSILVSLGLVLLGSGWTLTDISAGVSIQKLTYWALSGALAGVLAGAVNKSIRNREAKSEAEIAIGPMDDEKAIFGKLLVRYSGAHRPYSKVVLKTKEEYGGSLAYRGTEHTVLVGWYKVKKATLATAPQTPEKEFNRWVLNNLATLEQSNGIKHLESGTLERTGKFLLGWSNDQVAYTEMQEFGWDSRPLETV